MELPSYARPLARDVDIAINPQVVDAQQRRSQRARDQAMMIQMESLAEHLCDQFASYYQHSVPIPTTTTTAIDWGGTGSSQQQQSTHYPKGGNVSPAVAPAVPPIVPTDLIRQHVLLMQSQFEAAFAAQDELLGDVGGREGNTPDDNNNYGKTMIPQGGTRLKGEKDPLPLGQQMAPRPPPTPPVVRRHRAAAKDGGDAPLVPAPLQTRPVMGATTAALGSPRNNNNNNNNNTVKSSRSQYGNSTSSRRVQRRGDPTDGIADSAMEKEEEDQQPPVSIARADIDMPLKAPIVLSSTIATNGTSTVPGSGGLPLMSTMRSGRQRAENFRLLDCLLDGNTVCISQRKRHELTAVEQSLRDGARFVPLPSSLHEPAFLKNSPRLGGSSSSATQQSGPSATISPSLTAPPPSDAPLLSSQSAASAFANVALALKASNRIASVAVKMRDRQPDEGYAKQAEVDMARAAAKEAERWKSINGSKAKDWSPRDAAHQSALMRAIRTGQESHNNKQM